MRPRYAILLARSDLGTHALPPRSRHCRGCDENRSVLTCSNAGPYILPPNCDARNSFRIRFYEDCRVSPALRPSHQLPRLLYFHTLTNCKFSNSFALIFMQNAWGASSEWLCSSKPQPLRSYRPIASPIPFLFTFLRTLLRFFASRQNSTHLFSIASALFAQNRGGGVLWLTRFPMRKSVLRSIATNGHLFNGPRNMDHDSPWLLISLRRYFVASLLRYVITSSLPPASDLSPTGLTRPRCRRRRTPGTFLLPRRRGRTGRH